MCHQSVGLLQGAIEAAGMSTVSFTVRPEVTVNMRVPRAVYVRFPTGNPVGEPGRPNQQRRILRGALAALEAIAEPGSVLEMPYRWKRLADEDAEIAPAPRPAPAAHTRPEGGDLYATAQQQVAEIQARYAELLAAIDRYQAWLEAQVNEEQARPAPDSAKLQALGPQLKYLAELAGALEGPAHDGLVRVSDRVVRIRHWQEGVFI